jgi:hypothetical protein
MPRTAVLGGYNFLSLLYWAARTFFFVIFGNFFMVCSVIFTSISYEGIKPPKKAMRRLNGWSRCLKKCGWSGPVSNTSLTKKVINTLHGGYAHITGDQFKKSRSKQ